MSAKERFPHPYKECFVLLSCEIMKVPHWLIYGGLCRKPKAKPWGLMLDLVSLIHMIFARTSCFSPYKNIIFIIILSSYGMVSTLETKQHYAHSICFSQVGNIKTKLFSLKSFNFMDFTNHALHSSKLKLGLFSKK